MKLALVRVLGEDRHDSNSGDHNIGLGYLGAVAEAEGCTVSLFDPFDPENTPSFHSLLDSSFDIVGFTVHYLNIVSTLTIASTIKLNSPQTIIVFGGHHVSATAKELCADNDYIDAICVGEGEDFLRQIIQIYKENGNIADIRRVRIFYPQRYYDVNKLPQPLRNKVNKIARISTSRGCPYTCTFCTTPALRSLLDEPIYRDRAPENVVEEMSYLWERGATKIYINDDLYILPNACSKERARKIAELLLQNRINIEYKAQLRVDSLKSTDFATLKLLRESGLRSIFLGVESGDDSILLEYNKRATVQQAKDALKMYHEAGIQVNAGNILVSPNSSIYEIQNSILSFSSMELAYLFFRRVTFRAHIFPGTVLEARLVAQNRLESRPRYLPRKYKILDPKIEEITNRFEEVMPKYLKLVGTELFELRTQALHFAYQSKSSQNLVSLSEILSEWNILSTNLLINCFSDKRLMSFKTFKNEFEQFIAESYNIRQSLRQHLEKYNQVDFL